MADPTTSRIERALIEPLESRTMLSAVLLQQPQIVLETAPRPGFGGLEIVTVGQPLGDQQAGVLSVDTVPALRALGPVAGDEWFGQTVPAVLRGLDWQSSGDSITQSQPGPNVRPPQREYEPFHHADFGGPSLLHRSASLGLPEFPGDDHADYSQWQSAPIPEHPLLARPGDARPAIVVLFAQDGSAQVVVLPSGDPANSRMISDDAAPPPKQDATHPAAVGTVSGAQLGSSQGSAAPVASHAPADQPATSSVVAAAAAQTAAAPLRLESVSAAPRVNLDIDTAVVARASEAPALSASALHAQPLDPSSAIPLVAPVSPDTATGLAAIGTQPTAAVGAVRIATGWIRSVAAAIGQAFDQPGPVVEVPAAESLAPAAYNLLRISPAMLFNDTVGRIIREAASVSSVSSDASPGHTRAWAITGAVVLADAVLVGQWHLKRRRQLRLAHKRPLHRVFSAARI